MFLINDFTSSYNPNNEYSRKNKNQMTAEYPSALYFEFVGALPSFDIRSLGLILGTIMAKKRYSFDRLSENYS